MLAPQTPATLSMKTTPQKVEVVFSPLAATVGYRLHCSASDIVMAELVPMAVVVVVERKTALTTGVGDGDDEWLLVVV